MTKAHSARLLWKIINCDCFTSELPETAKPIGTNKMLRGGDRDGGGLKGIFGKGDIQPRM